MTDPTDRREFLRNMTLAGAGLAAFGPGALRAADAPAAKGDSHSPTSKPAPAATRPAKVDKPLNIGVIGTSFNGKSPGRGSDLALSFAVLPGAVVKYVCDVDDDHVQKAQAAVAAKQGIEPKAVKDLHRVLDDPSVDAVVIATPDHWHAPAAILACAAGKHVYVEKPCCHNPREGELLVEAARKHTRVVQHGTQRRSWPKNIEAIKRVKGGDIGRVLFVRGWYNNSRPETGRRTATSVPPGLDWEMWQGPAPRRPYTENVAPYKWHWFWNWGTGELGNNGVHALDVCRWGLGVDFPARVTAGGGRYYFKDDQETPDTLSVTYDFGDRAIVWEGRSCQPRTGSNLRSSGPSSTVTTARSLSTAAGTSCSTPRARRPRRSPAPGATPSTSRTSSTASRPATAPTRTSRTATRAPCSATSATSPGAPATRSTAIRRRAGSSATRKPRPYGGGSTRRGGSRRCRLAGWTFLPLRRVERTSCLLLGWTHRINTMRPHTRCRPLPCGVASSLVVLTTFAASPFAPHVSFAAPPDTRPATRPTTLPTMKPVPRMQAVPQPYSQVSFQREGEEVARYHFGPDLRRPFVFPVVGPVGRSLTRMGHPHDPESHSHHNSVWVSHNDVNGVSFWDDRGKGKIVHQRVDGYEDEGDVSSVSTTNHWVDTATGKVLLVERRRTTVQLLDDGEWLMLIDLQLEPAGKEDVTLGKTPFGLVGVRMAKTIGTNDGGGVIRNSEGGVNEKEIFWKPARWCDYSGPVTATAVEGVTLMDHPSNPDHPARFHVRADGWMGTSLTNQGPRVIQAGDSLRLRYGLYVHAGMPPVEKLQERWEAFAKTTLADLTPRKKKT